VGYREREGRDEEGGADELCAGPRLPPEPNAKLASSRFRSNASVVVIVVITGPGKKCAWGYRSAGVGMGNARVGAGWASVS